MTLAKTCFRISSLQNHDFYRILILSSHPVRGTLLQKPWYNIDTPSPWTWVSLYSYLNQYRGNDTMWLQKLGHKNVIISAFSLGISLLKSTDYALWKPKQSVEEPCGEVPKSLAQRLAELPGIRVSILKADSPAPNKATPDRNMWNKDELSLLSPDSWNYWFMNNVKSLFLF